MANSVRNSNSSVVLFAIAILGLILGYFYYNQALKDEAVAVPPVNILPNDNLVKFKDLKLDFTSFDSLGFRSLRIFGESPVRPGVTGRTDIFAPF